MVRKFRELETTLAVTSNSSYHRCVLQLLVIANVVPSSLILPTMIEVIRSSETSHQTRTARRHIPEDDTLHSHRSENLTSYIVLSGCVL
jgi:hypothetical protein